jgi:FMN-dependent oxidoreductase (nitrilotriacetate monooxygenase family)
MHLLTHLCLGPTNHHNGGWRHPDGDGHRVLDPGRYEDLARISEQGLFDGVFIIDAQFLPGLDGGEPSRLLKYGTSLSMLDPLQILVAMARVTKHIGVTATLSTSLYPAYHIARAFASIDHISGGRAGWNIVTSISQAEARNYGLDALKQRTDRYDYADEVVEACMALWSTWEPGALVINKASGVFADPEKVHYVKYDGAMVRTRGGLATPCPPQGHPVLMQAGSSERGRKFAARWAEVIFTTQSEKSAMQAFYAEMKARVQACGRNPDHCIILPPIDVIVAESEQQARDEADYVDTFANVEMGQMSVSFQLGMDVSHYPPDTLVADLPVDPDRVAIQGFYQNFLSGRKGGRGLTLGELIYLQATTWMNPRLVGTPSMIVDQMQDLFEAGACDGFIIGTSTSPMGLRNFVELIVPELQRRGLHRTEYSGSTFRHNLREGLPCMI